MKLYRENKWNPKFHLLEFYKMILFLVRLIFHEISVLDAIFVRSDFVQGFKLTGQRWKMFDQGKLQLSCAPLRLTQSLKNVKTDRAPYSKVSQQIERFPFSLKLI